VGTGGQKSFCMSTIMRAAVEGLKGCIVVLAMSGRVVMMMLMDPAGRK
jgi:hypothetical protein